MSTSGAMVAAAGPPAIPIAVPARATIDTTTYDDPYGAPGDKMAVLVADDWPVRAYAAPGDLFPRFVETSDPNDGTYRGNGSYDPTANGAGGNDYYEPGEGMYVFETPADRIWLGGGHGVRTFSDDMTAAEAGKGFVGRTPDATVRRLRHLDDGTLLTENLDGSNPRVIGGDPPPVVGDSRITLVLAAPVSLPQGATATVTPWAWASGAGPDLTFDAGTPDRVAVAVDMTCVVRVRFSLAVAHASTSLLVNPGATGVVLGDNGSLREPISPLPGHDLEKSFLFLWRLEAGAQILVNAGVDDGLAAETLDAAILDIARLA